MEFFLLRSRFLRNEYRVMPSVKSLDFYNLYKGNLNQTEILFTHSGGKNHYDLMNTGFAGLYLFSDRLVYGLEKNKIKGWTTYPIKIIDEGHINSYRGFSVIGKCGRLDKGKSEVINCKNPDNYPYQIRRGLYFDPLSWDGSDVFSPEGTMFTFVSERTKDALSEFSNIEFQHIKEIETSMY